MNRNIEDYFVVPMGADDYGVPKNLQGGIAPNGFAKIRKDLRSALAEMEPGSTVPVGDEHQARLDVEPAEATPSGEPEGVVATIRVFDMDGKELTRSYISPLSDDVTLDEIRKLAQQALVKMSRDLSPDSLFDTKNRLTVGDLRALCAGLDDETLVLVANDGWYQHVENVGVPNAECDPWACLTLFPGVAFDSRDI